MDYGLWTTDRYRLLISLRRRAEIKTLCQGGASPGRRADGDELVVAVRVTVIEIGLDRPRARLHIPGAVLRLRLDQVLDAALVSRIRTCQTSCLQHEQGLPSGIGIALPLCRLRPAAALVLRR